MGPKKNSQGKAKAQKPEAKRKTTPSAPRRLLAEQQQNASRPKKALEEKEEGNAIFSESGLSEAVASIPVPLQQLLLNIFRTALLPDTSSTEQCSDGGDLHAQIQTLKAHLYNRDFVSAFADASPELLRAYALRWSASRCLAYVGIFKGVVAALLDSVAPHQTSPGSMQESDNRGNMDNSLRVLCIGGGAGAEIVALAGVWRALLDEQSIASTNPNQNEDNIKPNLAKSALTEQTRLPKLSVTAVDIAEWSSVVNRLCESIHSPAVPGQKTCPAPLLEKFRQETSVDTSFRHLDVLSLSEPDLSSLLSPHDGPKTMLVSLMFTLNELFTTSMPKTAQLLLRITDETDPGTILLIVDSPGSYSTLSLGGGSEPAKQRQYPMKFLLEHTLLTVAQGKWEKLLSQDSRWFRREASKLAYSVNLEGGDGLVRLEDMRYQIHVYRRIPMK